MSCSPARLAANRANALRSSGPKTEEGKAKSRANAMKHGLCAEILRTPDEDKALEAKPPGEWLEAESALLMMRISRAHRAEEREREHAAMRAESCWDDDRRREADRIGRGLGKTPERVVLRLRATVQGCDWLIERWGWLATAATQEGGWDAGQIRLASDLRGIPEMVRVSTSDRAGQAAMADQQIRSLTTVRASLVKSDAFERETTRRGLDDAATPELRRVLRYEAALHRRLRWCLDQQKPRPVAPPARSAPKIEPPRPALTLPLPAPDRLDAPSFGPPRSWTSPLPDASVPIAMIPAKLQRPRLN